MPLLALKNKKNYYYRNDLKNNSLILESIIKNNFKKKDEYNKINEKYIEGGMKKYIKKFDKNLKKKIKDY